MHQTCKGKQWYFGMKVHIGVDSESGLIHSVETTAAHVHELASPPAFRKDDTPLNRKPGGLMEQSNASLQRGDQG